MIPVSVSALVRARRLPVFTTADVERLITAIKDRREKHLGVQAELATLRLMRAAQLRAAVQAKKQARRTA